MFLLTAAGTLSPLSLTAHPFAELHDQPLPSVSRKKLFPPFVNDGQTWPELRAPAIDATARHVAAITASSANVRFIWFLRFVIVATANSRSRRSARTGPLQAPRHGAPHRPHPRTGRGGPRPRA